MEASSDLDPFKLCWELLFKESLKFNNAFFNSGHCNLLDSRDNNFALIENRLAYIYKYGSFNIFLVEKCLSKFLNEYPAVETLLHLENLKVCSLSNGPGLDIVGLLYALHKSNKPLKCFPLLKAISFHESWTNLYELAVQSAYQRVNLKWCSEYFDIPSDNISLIQGDVLSKLSTEAKKYISESNLLLMVKVFISSKATPDIFCNSLREIFLLTKPGTLIIFIGSKTNTKRFSKSKSLKRYVKCIFGPQKVTVENLSYDASITDKSIPDFKSITDLVGTKPLDSGYADFMVWQKKAVVDAKEVIKTKKKKKTSQDLKDVEDVLDCTVTEECGGDSDVESEMSFTSESKYSDASWDDFGSDSNSSVLISPDVPKSNISEKEQDLSLDGSSHFTEKNAPFLDKGNIGEKETLNSLQNKTNTAHEIEIETKISVDKYIVKSLKNQNSPNESKNSEVSVINDQLQDATEKQLNTQDIKFETSIITDINSMLLSNINQFTEARNDEISGTLPNEMSQAEADITIEKKENSPDIKFETNLLASNTDSKMPSNVNSLEGIKSSEISKISLNVKSPLKKGNILEYNVNCTNISMDSVNETLQTNLVNPFTQDVNQKDTRENTCGKKSKNKNKNLSSELKAGNGNIKKQSKPVSHKVSSMTQSCENLCSRNVISSTESACLNEENDTQALFQKCESLVTSLEKLTAKIKNDISSSSNTNFVKTCCSTGQAYGICRVHNSHTKCINSASRCCCRQVYSCQRTQNSCRSCFCSFPCESSTSRFYAGSPSLLRPYITIPLENEDLLHILASRK